MAGKYRVTGLIGEGGMGMVLAALHVDLLRPVAIKVVRRELARNEEIVARMLSEAQAAACIRSEHVARVMDVGRLPSGAPFLVLEYLEGRDLAALLDEAGPLDPCIAVDCILQVCDALAEAHARGIVHRDLKPENLFCTQRADGSATVKVLDFGISKNLSVRDRRAAKTNPCQLVGSPYYMAPEQIRNGWIDARSDIWALGVVLYELCTGQTPFAADSIPSVCHSVLNQAPTPPRTFATHLAVGLEDLILRCLSKDPAQRFADVGSLAIALAPFGGAEAKTYAARIQRVIHATRPRAPCSAESEEDGPPTVREPALKIVLDDTAPESPTQVSLIVPRVPDVLPDVLPQVLDMLPRLSDAASPCVTKRSARHRAAARPKRQRRRRRGSMVLALMAGIVLGASGAGLVSWTLHSTRAAEPARAAQQPSQPPARAPAAPRIAVGATALAAAPRASSELAVETKGPLLPAAGEVYPAPVAPQPAGAGTPDPWRIELYGGQR